jgi:hypothetical protein
MGVHYLNIYLGLRVSVWVKFLFFGGESGVIINDKRSYFCSPPLRGGDEGEGVYISGKGADAPCKKPQKEINRRGAAGMEPFKSRTS